MTLNHEEEEEEEEAMIGSVTGREIVKERKWLQSRHLIVGNHLAHLVVCH